MVFQIRRSNRCRPVRSPDPSAGEEQGKFSNPFLQDLYENVTLKGDISKPGALNAGIIVDKTNNADLKTGIASAEHCDIKHMYSRLIAALDRHHFALENFTGY